MGTMVSMNHWHDGDLRRDRRPWPLVRSVRRHGVSGSQNEMSLIDTGLLRAESTGVIVKDGKSYRSTLNPWQSPQPKVL
jgi:hypothetical protein